MARRLNRSVSVVAAVVIPGGGLAFPVCPFAIGQNGGDQRGVSRPQSAACDIGATEQ